MWLLVGVKGRGDDGVVRVLCALLVVRACVCVFHLSLSLSPFSCVCVCVCVCVFVCVRACVHMMKEVSVCVSNGCLF